MALADFIQSLQEQDTVYSTPPQPSIRVIPPENQSIKVIPPETLAVDPPAPKVIKLKIKPKTEPTVAATPVTTAPVEPTPVMPVVSTPVSNTILQPVSKKPEATPVSVQTQDAIPKYVPQEQSITQPNIVTQPKLEVTPKPVSNEPLTEDDIFNSTGTEYSKKQIWLEYFEKARTSRKSNPIVDRMRVGRFTITPDNKVLLLPDYDIVGKDPDDVLKDKWF